MAESYKKMDKGAADGMKTSEDKTAAVAEAWARVRSDAETAVEWATFQIDGKVYALKAEGAGVDAFVAALPDDAVTFAGLRVGDKFFHVLSVGPGVGIIKRNKAQMQKNAPFNAMPGTSADVELPADEKTPEKLRALLGL